MESNDDSGRTEASAAGDGAPRGEPGLLDQVMSLWGELHGLVHDQLTLAAIEARLAGRSLAIMIAAGIMVGALLVSAWLGIMAVVALWLIGAGATASVALLLVVAVNLAAAVMLSRLILRQSRYLQFPRTLQSLGPAPKELQGSEGT